MLSPTDYNSAVPQFEDGSYASDPLNPLYVEKPGANDYRRGSEPLQTLPAQWWNWLCNQFTARFNKLNIYVKNIFDELSQLLSLVELTPDATESEITTGQIKSMFQTNYPQYLVDNFSSSTPIENSTKFFTAGGMFDFTLGSNSAFSWLNKVFGNRYCLGFKTGTISIIGIYFIKELGLYVGYSNVSGSKGFYWSHDGYDWTLGTSMSANILEFVYDMGILVASTNAGGLYWSEDGVNWTKSTGIPSDATVQNLSCNGTIWVALRNAISSNNLGLYWSEDGKVWTSCTGGDASTRGKGEASYGNGIWCICTITTGSSGNGIWWSTDGKSWTKGSGVTSGLGQGAVIYGNGIFVAGLTYNGGILWSTNGKTWTQAVSSYSAFNPYYLNGIWLCGNTSSNGARWSTDGKTWNAISVFSGKIVQSFHYANGVYHALGVATPPSGGGTPTFNGAYYSLDGKTFTQCTGLTSVQTNICKYANGVWVIATQGSGAYRSVNGRGFDTIPEIPSGAAMGINYANGVWNCATYRSGLKQLIDDGYFTD